MKKGFIIFGILLLILLVNPILAQPSISSVSGSVSDGGSVSISGLGFGVAGPSLYKWDDFEGATHVLNDPVGAGPGDIPWEMRNSNNPSYIDNTNNRVGSTNYANTNYYYGECPSCYVGGIRFNYGGATPSPVYVTYYWRWDGNGGHPPDFSNSKTWVIADDDTSDGCGPPGCPRCGMTLWNGGSSGAIGSGSKYVYCSDDNRDAVFQVGIDSPTEGEWIRLEFFGIESTTGNSDGTIYYAGQMDSSNPFVVWKSMEGTAHTRDSYHWSHSSFHEFAGMNSATINFDWDLDDVYIADSRARVEIGDNAVFASCTQREIQEATVWADGSINVNVNQGSFTNGETAYLFVVDANGDVSTGYAVTISGTPTYECNDTIDNDGDGAIDFPNDAGCTDVNDNDETNCDDGVCEGGEDCSSCVADCPTGSGQVCCSSVTYTGDCCDNNDCIAPETCVSHVCTFVSSCSPADTSGDDIVSITELMTYIGNWKAGSVTITALMTGIGEWKNGC